MDRVEVVNPGYCLIEARVMTRRKDEKGGITPNLECPRSRTQTLISKEPCALEGVPVSESQAALDLTFDWYAQKALDIPGGRDVVDDPLFQCHEGLVSVPHEFSEGRMLIHVW